MDCPKRECQSPMFAMLEKTTITCNDINDVERENKATIPVFRCAACGYTTAFGPRSKEVTLWAKKWLRQVGSS